MLQRLKITDRLANHACLPWQLQQLYASHTNAGAHTSSSMGSRMDSDSSIKGQLVDIELLEREDELSLALMETHSHLNAAPLTASGGKSNRRSGSGAAGGAGAGTGKDASSGGGCRSECRIAICGKGAHGRN